MCLVFTTSRGKERCIFVFSRIFVFWFPVFIFLVGYEFHSLQKLPLSLCILSTLLFSLPLYSLRTWSCWLLTTCRRCSCPHSAPLGKRWAETTRWKKLTSSRQWKLLTVRERYSFVAFVTRWVSSDSFVFALMVVCWIWAFSSLILVNQLLPFGSLRL